MNLHHTKRRALALLGLLALLSATGCGVGMPTSPVVDASHGTVGAGGSSVVLDTGGDTPNEWGGSSWAPVDTVGTSGSSGHGHGHNQNLKKPKKH